MGAPEFGNFATRILLTLNLAAILAWDAFALWKWGTPATISYVFYDLAKNQLWAVLLIILLLGILVGHFLAPLKLD